MAGHNLKPGWTWVSFGDVVKLNTDRCADPVAAGIERYVGLEHIEPEDLRIRRWGLVEEGTTFTNRFRPGQVLFGKCRAYQRKVAVADFEGVCSSDIYIFEPKDDRLLPELLPFLCQTEAFYEHAVGTSAGSLSPRTNWTQLTDHEFALPPLEEQARIASILSAAQQLREELWSAVKRASSAYLSYSNRVFAPNGLDQELRPEHWVSSSWEITRLGQLTAQDAPICYGIVQIQDNTEHGIPTLVIKNLGGDYHSGIHRTAKTIESKYSRSRVQEGDVLVSIEGTIGEIGIVPQGFSGNISRHLARIRLDSTQIKNGYFVHLYKSLPFRRYVQSLVVGSTRAEISIATLREMLVPVPPLHIQSSITARLTNLAQSKSALQRRLDSLQALRRDLLNNLL